MRRLVALLWAAPVTLALASPPWPASGDGNPSVLDPSVPLSYVGNDASVSLGINGEGQTEGQLLGVFARSNARAVVGQLWWDRAGAGGLQADYNWLWRMSGEDARAHPDAATVARLSFAVDQNADRDRKATLGFGIERREFSLEGYLASGISSARNSGSLVQTSATSSSGIDTIGSYTQIDTSTLETLFESRPYRTEIGFQASHVFEPLALRLHAGASVQDGDGARANTFSLGVDTPLGTRGWGLSALAEHVSRHGGVDAGSDDRLSVYIRYEFGRRGSFVPTSELVDPAWIARALGQPSDAHPRIVESYQTRRSQTTTVTHSPKVYGNRFPLLRDDSATAVDGQALLIDVLANDSDPDGDPLHLVAVTAAAHGVAVIAGDRISYTPTPGFSGTDTFRYTASDGRGGSGSAQVSVATAPRPDQPPLARADNATTPFGQPVTIAVLANDSDPDGDPLSIVAVTAPASGSAAIAGNMVIYTPGPAGAATGIDRFDYTISDGRGGTSSATVTVTIAARPDRPPVAVDDDAITGFGQATRIAVLANDSDPDGDPLNIASVTAPTAGSAVIAGDQIVYTPPRGFAGVDRFGYTISDGRGGTAGAFVTVTVRRGR